MLTGKKTVTVRGEIENVGISEESHRKRVEVRATCVNEKGKRRQGNGMDCVRRPNSIGEGPEGSKPPQLRRYVRESSRL
jgi:hypothetical protein